MFARLRRPKVVIEIDLKWTYLRDYRKLEIRNRERTDLRNHCFSFFFVMRSQKLNFYISKYVPIMK